MTIPRFNETDQLELPLWLDINQSQYTGVMWCTGNRFVLERKPLCYMINSFQWVHTPEDHCYWLNVLNKIERMEIDGRTHYSAAAREYGMGQVLVAAFNFSTTPEGPKYWYEVVDRLRCIDKAFKDREIKS